jgi:DNA polymerase iota
MVGLLRGGILGGMFRRQEDVLREFRVVDEVTPIVEEVDDGVDVDVGKQVSDGEEEPNDDGWDADEDEDGQVCDLCGVRLPGFAMVAHRRFHALP